MPTRREFLLKGTAGLAAAASSRIAYAANANTKNDKAAPKAAAAVVETVLGPLDVSKLGFTLSHEHVCFVPHEAGDRTAAAAKMVTKLKEAKAGGVDTIIDLTPADAWRDVRFGQEVARKSGMQIVVCTWRVADFLTHY